MSLYFFQSEKFPKFKKELEITLEVRESIRSSKKK